MGEGQRTRFSPTRWGCIINPYQENNAVRKFEKGRRTAREREHLLGKVKKENKSEGEKKQTVKFLCFESGIKKDGQKTRRSGEFRKH